MKNSVETFPSFPELYIWGYSVRFFVLSTNSQHVEGKIPFLKRENSVFLGLLLRQLNYAEFDIQLNERDEDWLMIGEAHCLQIEEAHCRHVCSM